MQEKVLVLHVKVGYEERAKHIEHMLHDKQVSFEYITDGDQADITEEVLDRYFVGAMHNITAATSCALKHFYAYSTSACLNAKTGNSPTYSSPLKTAVCILYREANAEKTPISTLPNVIVLPDATISAKSAPN